MMDWKRKWSIAGHIFFWTCLFLLYLYVNNARFSLEMAVLQSVILLIVIIPVTYFNIVYLIPTFFGRKSKSLYIVYLVGIIFLGTTLIIFFEEVNFLRAFDNDRVLVIFDEKTPPNGHVMLFRNERGPAKSIPLDSLRQRGFSPYDSGKIVMPPDMFVGAKRVPSEFRGFPPARPRPWSFSVMRWFIRLFQVAFIVLLATVYRISQIMTEKEKEALLLESEKFSSELKFLKSQINPHFLFNALNNIYTLSVIRSETTPDVVMRLSDMLKYIIYETETRDFVPLEKEIAYIENFIAIFKLKDSRIEENVSFEYDIPEKLSIAPMILIPFIENAFKHSKIEDVKNGWIEIRLAFLDPDLVFSVKNSVPSAQFEKDKVGGIGIANVKRRLDLIYAKKHALSITEGDNVFAVEMKIAIDNEN